MGDLDTPKAPEKDWVVLTPLMRQIVAWSVWTGAGVLGISYVARLLYLSWQDGGWMEETMKEHFAAIVGLPLAAVAAFLVVNALQITAGKIEVEAWGFKLHGAS